MHERPNVPGTIDEFPNWRLALPAPLEEIEQADGVMRIADGKWKESWYFGDELGLLLQLDILQVLRGLPASQS